jgi:hypothetical protein
MFFRVIFVYVFLELFLSPISIYQKKLVLTQLVAHAVMAFQTISNKQKNRQTDRQTDKQLQTRRSVLKGLSMRIIYSQVFEQQQSIKISFCTYCKS